MSSEENPSVEEPISIPIVVDEQAALEELQREVASSVLDESVQEDVSVGTESEPINFGDEVRLQTPPASSDDDRQRTISQDDYEMISSSYKRSSMSSEERDKTPTPPEIRLPQEPTVTPISVLTDLPNTPPTSIVIEREDSPTSEQAVQNPPLSLWQRISNFMATLTNWIKWMFGF